MSMGKSYLFRKELGVGIVVFLLIVSIIPNINAGYFEDSISTESTTNFSDKQLIYENREKIISECLSAASKIDDAENQFNSEYVENKQNQFSEQPLLGGNEVFGLWITIVYNGNEISEKIDMNPWTIRGKLSDPGYRTPLKFNVDNDPEEDIEVGFGFFRYGIDEITESGTKDHSAWATAFDFMQINNGLDDQLGEIEVWQEFHVNIGLIKNSAVNNELNLPFLLDVLPDKGMLKTILSRLYLIIQSRLVDNPIFDYLLNHLNEKNHEFIVSEQITHNQNKKGSIAASEDYFVTRVGFRSEENQKIPFRFEKTFAIAKDNIFRPFIFQHEMNPNDIISSASNDVMFGFQSFKEGNSKPSYDVEFEVNFNPAVHTLTQFIPRSGKIFYYYRNVGPSDSLDITFSSNLLKGGDDQEEEEGSLSLTLTIDTPVSIAGSGKWMSFDPKIIGDIDPLGGKFTYAASHNFDIGIIANSPRFEEKLEIKGLPKNAELEWDVDVDLNIGSMVKLEVDGYVQLDMDSQIDEVIVYFPKSNSTDSDMSFLEVHGIPSYEKTGAIATLYVDPNNIFNPSNYVYGKAYRDYSTNLEAIEVFLPNVSTPIVEITDIPSYSAVTAQLIWNKLQGYARAERYSSGAPDPVKFNLDFDTFSISNILEISDGYAQGDFKIASNGYLGFDTSKKMFSDSIEISDSAEESGLSVSVEEISANNLGVNWGLDNSGEQIKLTNLGFNGFLSTLKDFQVSISLEGKSGEFQGDWSLGESGNFEIDFYQDENIQLDFDLGDNNGTYDFNGYIELNNDLHYDMSWKWKQGNYNDPAYFRINENSNEANLEEINLYFSYQDNWGADITLQDAGIYVCVEWYWQNLILYIWPIIEIYGTVDLDLLLNGIWYYNVEDNWP